MPINPAAAFNQGAVVINTKPFYDSINLQRQKVDKEQAALDEEMKSNVSAMRDADVPDFIEKYKKYAANRKELLFNPKVKKDPHLYAQLQMENARDYADALKLAKGSKDFRQQLEVIDKDRLTNRERYDDDYYPKRSVMNKLPLSKLNQVDLGYRDEKGLPVYHDLSILDNLLYKGTNTDFNKTVQSSLGTPRKVLGKPIAVDKLGLETSTPVYLAPNSPAQVKDNLMGAFSVHNVGRDAEIAFKNLPPGEFEKTVQEYAAIPKEKLEKMGIDKLEDLMPRNPDSRVEGYASYLAMKHAINYKPIEDAPIRDTNKAVERNLKMRDAKELALFNNQLDREKEEFKAKLKGKSDEEMMNSIDQRLSGIENAAVNKNKGFTVYNIDGKGQDQLVYEIAPSSGLLKAFEKKDKYGKTVQPNKVGYKDGVYYPIYIETDINYNPIRKGKGYVYDKDLTRPVRRADLKADYSSVMLSPKLVEGNLEAGETGNNYTPPSKTKTAKPIKLKPGAFD